MAADLCLNTVLTQLDTYRCLSVCHSLTKLVTNFSVLHSVHSQTNFMVRMFVVLVEPQSLPIHMKPGLEQVVVPLLVSEDEKALVICIGCLTKVICPI